MVNPGSATKEKYQLKAPSDFTRESFSKLVQIDKHNNVILYIFH